MCVLLVSCIILSDGGLLCCSQCLILIQ
uniref:Uncharacterized protein n=1 Tax=Anguilla anguilla TaxID=7936 RepID=A0A0E9V545_ANGAN